MLMEETASRYGGMLGKYSISIRGEIRKGSSSECGLGVGLIIPSPSKYHVKQIFCA
jgi:hypothetical protein